MSQVWILELLFRDRETEVSCNSSLKSECQQCNEAVWLSLHYCQGVSAMFLDLLLFCFVFCLQVNYIVLLIWIQISPTHLSTDVTVWTEVSSSWTVVCVQNLNKYKWNNQMNHFFGQQTFFKASSWTGHLCEPFTTVKTMTRLECWVVTSTFYCSSKGKQGFDQTL